MRCDSGPQDAYGQLRENNWSLNTGARAFAGMPASSFAIPAALGADDKNPF